MPAIDPFPPLAVFEAPDTEMPRGIERDPSRGVGWVLRWAGAAFMLFTSCVLLAEFSYRCSAERTLARAAQAGAMEATLPSATYHTVQVTIGRRLSGLVHSDDQWRLDLKQNDTTVRSIELPKRGDQFSVTIVVSDRAVLPAWLRTLGFWKRESAIEAHADKRVPGRPVGEP